MLDLKINEFSIWWYFYVTFFGQKVTGHQAHNGP